MREVVGADGMGRPIRRTPVAERMRQHITTAGDCLVWTGSRNHRGYGRVNTGTVVESAHRVAWVLANGAIPDGLCVLHRCDNRACVRVDHLFLGTPKDNSVDMVNKGRSPRVRGEASGMAKVSTASVIAIRAAAAAGERQTSIAARFGIHPAHVSRIVSKKRRGWG